MRTTRSETLSEGQIAVFYHDTASNSWKPYDESSAVAYLTVSQKLYELSVVLQSGSKV